MKLRVSLISLKETLVKEAIGKIAYKQTMWRVYRRTRKDEDFANYKEALNASTKEIQHSKRSYEQLACNIKKYEVVSITIDVHIFVDKPPLNPNCQFDASEL